MKKWVRGAVLLAVAVLALGSCQKDKYAEAKKLMRDYIAMNNLLGKSMDEADTGAEVAAALKTFVAKAKVLGPQVEGLEDKYPELGDEENLPQDMKDLMAEVETSLEAMAGLFGKLMQYGDDPAVQEAMAEFQEME